MHPVIFTRAASAELIEAQGWYARILQHETDHLHGTLFIDRMLTRSFMTRQSYDKLWKDTPVPEFLRDLENE